MNRLAPIGMLLLLTAAGVAGATEEKAAAKNWALGCGGQDGDCALEQRIFVEGFDKAPLVRMTFKVLDAKANGHTARRIWMLVNVPLGVQLAAGLKLQVDQGALITAAYHHCHAGGCLALFPLEDGLRRQFSAGRKASLTFQMLDGRSVGVPVSLEGLADGLSKLEEKMRLAP